jgi:hypothetical protein
MKKAGFIRNLAAAAVIAAFAGGAVADTIVEAEDNSPVAAAQPLVFDSGGMAVVEAFVGNGDADVFSFQAKEGDIVTVDIDAVVKGSAVDTFLTVLQTQSMGAIVMRENDDGPDGSPDSYITGISIPADGTYYIGVAGYQNRVVDGGVLRGGTGNSTGAYTLKVSGVSPVVAQPEPEPEPETPPQTETPPQAETPPQTETPPQAETPSDDGPVTSPFPQQPVEVLSVGIDIKPGERRIAKIDPRSRRDIPVALLGSRNFNVRNVDVSSLTFGSTGNEDSLKRCSRHTTRVNRDRRRDLICWFEQRDAGFETTDEEGVLKGRLKDGTLFEGRGMLKVIAEKRKHHRHDWRDDRRGRDNDRRKDRR